MENIHKSVFFKMWYHLLFIHFDLLGNIYNNNKHDNKNNIKFQTYFFRYLALLNVTN